MTDEATPAKKGSMGKILISLVIAAVLVFFGGWFGSLAFFAPKEGALVAWEQTLDAAIAKRKPVLVKAGSKW